MSELSLKRVCFANQGTPRRHKRSTERRLAVTHGDGEVHSSPTLVRQPLTFQMIRNSPVQRAIQSVIT